MVLAVPYSRRRESQCPKKVSAGLESICQVSVICEMEEFLIRESA